MSLTRRFGAYAAAFEIADDVIVRREDRYDAANRTVLEDYVAEHGAKLGLTGA